MSFRPFAAAALLALMSVPALGADVKVFGGETLSPFQLKMRYHVDSGLSALVAIGLHRDGYWNLDVPAYEGNDLRVTLDTQKLPACGTALGLYFEDGGKGQLANGFLDNGNLIALIQTGGNELLLDLNKDGIGHYAGKVIDAKSGKQYDASLDWAGASMGFDTSNATVSLNGTPLGISTGGVTVYYHKDAASALTQGLKVAHAGAEGAGLCYKANTVSTFSPEALPAIAMTYSGSGTDGAGGMVVIGLTNQVKVQDNPRVISSFITTTELGIGVDVFE